MSLWVLSHQERQIGSRHTTDGQERCTGSSDSGLTCLSLADSCESIQVLGGGALAIMRNRSPCYHSQIWNAVSRIPDSRSSQFFNKGNDSRCWVYTSNWSISGSEMTMTLRQPRSFRGLEGVPELGWPPRLTKVARRIFFLLRNIVLKSRSIVRRRIPINCWQMLIIKSV